MRTILCSNNEVLDYEAGTTGRCPFFYAPHDGYFCVLTRDSSVEKAIHCCGRFMECGIYRIMKGLEGF